jgi:biopolymer transport protein ExbD
MKLYNFRTFLVLFTTLFFVMCFTLWNYSEHKTIYTFRVKIPKAYNPNFTDGELLEFLESGGNMIPIDELEKRNFLLPNDDRFLIISLEKDGKLKINQQFNGTLENIEPLLEKLKEIFANRERLGVFEENTNKAVKAVIVKAPRSFKYGDFLKVIDAVKESGADPIVLQIDDLPQ